jgi:hypothetical protein
MGATGPRQSVVVSTAVRRLRVAARSARSVLTCVSSATTRLVSAFTGSAAIAGEATLAATTSATISTATFRMGPLLSVNVVVVASVRWWACSGTARVVPW